MCSDFENTKATIGAQLIDCWYTRREKKREKKNEKLTCKSTRFLPFKCAGDEQRVFCPSREKVFSVRESHIKWQSHMNELSDSFRLRRCSSPLNMSFPSVVSLLLLSVLSRTRRKYMTMPLCVSIIICFVSLFFSLCAQRYNDTRVYTHRISNSFSSRMAASSIQLSSLSSSSLNEQNNKKRTYFFFFIQLRTFVYCI